MDKEYLEGLFQLSGRVAAITGGAGVLCGAMSRALARRRGESGSARYIRG